MNRATLKHAVRVPDTGHSRGVFTGAHAAVELRPAEPGRGVNIAVNGSDPFPASIAHLDTRPVHPAFAQGGARHTSLARSPDSPPIFTVEHLLGALAGLGVTDALITVDSDVAHEIPIFDGSARPFAEAIALAGLEFHAEPVVWIGLPRPVEVTSGDAVVRCDPCPPEFAAFRYELEYDHPFLAAQSAEWSVGDRVGFIERVAPARTFSLEAEARAAQSAGLFTDFSPRDLLVIGAHGPIDNELRFDNEPAAHKLLDLVGDLALAAHELGGPIAMTVRAHKSGHALHHLAARAIVRAVRES